MFDNVKGEYFLPEVHVVGWLKLSGGSPSEDYKQGKYRQIYQIICFLLLFPVYRLPKVLWGSSGLELPFGSPQSSSGGQGKNLNFSFCHMPHINFPSLFPTSLLYPVPIRKPYVFSFLKYPDAIKQGKFIDYISPLIIVFYRVELCLIYPSHLFPDYIHLAESSCVV